MGAGERERRGGGGGRRGMEVRREGTGEEEGEITCDSDLQSFLRPKC